MQGTSGAHAFELLIDFLYAACDPAPIGLELCFSRTSGSDAAAETRHFHAVSGKSRQHVVELGQFNLQSAFPCSRPAGENIENELRAVDDLDLQLFFQIALLRRRQILIEDDYGRAGRGDGSRQLANLSRSDERCGLELVACLDVALGDAGADARSELGQLLQRFFGIEGLRGASFELEANQDCLLSGDARPPKNPDGPRRSKRPAFATAARERRRSGCS